MELAKADFVSPTTAKTLQQFGWAEGDPIPVALGEKMVEWRKEIENPSDTTVLVAKADLTDEQIAEVVKLLEDAKVYFEKKKGDDKLNAKLAKMKPSVAAEYMKTLQTNKPNSEIVDDREEVATEEKGSAALPAQEVTAKPHPVNCPRCGWDVAVPHEVKITDNDKEDFLSSILGGHRFRKKFDLFGGRFVVHFRSLTSAENEMVYRQISLDQGNDVITTRAQWLIRVLDYRMACALEKITDKDGKIINEFPEIDLSVSGKDQTAILPRYDEMNQTALTQEAVRRLVGQHLREFFRLTEALESMALDPSFWNGIE